MSDNELSHSRYCLKAQSHRTATVLRPSATLNLVWSLTIAALSRSIAVTPKHRSQQIAVFLHDSKYQSHDCIASILRLYYDLRRTTATTRSAVVVWSHDYRTTSETAHRACSDHRDSGQTLLRPFYDRHRPYCDRRRQAKLPIKGWPSSLCQYVGR